MCRTGQMQVFGDTQTIKNMDTKLSIHPTIYECDDFILYLEKWNGLSFIHLTLNKWGKSVFKELKKKTEELAKENGFLYGYAEDDKTYRIMGMIGFEDANFHVWNTNNKIGRVLCLH